MRTETAWRRKSDGLWLHLNKYDQTKFTNDINKASTPIMPPPMADEIEAVEVTVQRVVTIVNDRMVY